MNFGKESIHVLREVFATIVVIKQSLPITNTGSEIAPSWSPMRPKIQFWRPEFHSWSPAGDL